ncbi:MAG: hypothetical protein JNM69_28870 [Archangium sp.]|nr:hypothetical protein [Archangium sp.]
MTRWPLVVLLLAPVVFAQPAFRARPASFTTNSTSFVEVPNSRLTGPLQGGEFGLLLWHASLRSSVGAPSTAELIIEPPDGGNLWGFMETGNVVPDSPQGFRNFDWDVGTPIDLVARVRSNVPDASVTVSNFEALFLPLGSESEILRQERFGNTVVESGGWTDLGTVTVHRASRQWLLLAQANVVATIDQGVTLRVRVQTPSGPLSVPATLDTTVRGSSLFSRQTTGAFFVAQHLTGPAVGDTITFEASSAPGFADAGLPSVLHDVRLAVIPVLELDQTAATPGVLTLAPVVGMPQLSTTSNPGVRHTLSVYSTLAAGSDAGLVTIWQSASRTTQTMWPAIAGVEQPVLSDWSFELQNPALTSSLFLRTLAGVGAAAQPRLSLWKWDGGVIDLPLPAPDGGVDAGSLVDAGSTDAGSTDAGSTAAGSTDAGSTDAGSTDAGSTDAGSTDAGSTDAGDIDAGIDAGATLDAGTTTDAGAAADAGAEPTRKTFTLGCSSTGELGWLALLLVLLRRRL